MKSAVTNRRHWNCKITHLSSVDECHGFCAARSAFETMDTGHRLRRALLAGVRPSSHTQGAERRTGFCLAERSREPRPTREQRSSPIGCMVQQVLSAKSRTTCSCLVEDASQKVAPECLRQASVAEQTRWDNMTKEKHSPKMRLMKRTSRWQNPFSANLEDCSSQRCRIEGGINSPLNDDNNALVSEWSDAGNEDPNEDERQVEVPDLLISCDSV